MILKRGNRWAARVWENGRWRWLGTFDTRREAQLAELRARSRPVGPNPPVAQWLGVLEERWERSLAPKSRAPKRRLARALLAELGERRLGELTPSEAADLAARWPATRTRFARHVWTIACREGLCYANPWASITLPPRRGRRDIVPPDAEEIEAIVARAAALDPHYAPMAAAIIRTLGFVGLRPGELVGVRWEDVGDSTIAIRRAADGAGGWKLPKNGRVRVVALAPQCRLQALPRHADGWVFRGRAGRPLTQSALAFWWLTLQRAGVTARALYELRHAAAHILVEAGVEPALVAHQLGHTDGGHLVAALYGHPSERRARELAQAAWRRLESAGPAPRLRRIA